MIRKYWKKIKKFGDSVSDFFEEVNIEIEADERRKLLLDNEHEIILAAHKYFEEGELELAKSAYLAVLGTDKKLLNSGLSVLIDCLINLAEIHEHEEDFDESILLLTNCIEVVDEKSGSTQALKASVLDKLAKSYRLKSNLKKAESLYLHSLKLKEKVLKESQENQFIGLSITYEVSHDKEKGEIAKTAGYLACLYHVLGLDSKAIPLILKSLAFYDEFKFDFHKSNSSNGGCLVSSPGPEINLILSELSILFNDHKELIESAKSTQQEIKPTDENSVREEQKNYSVDSVDKQNHITNTDVRWYYDESFYENVFSSEESIKAESKRELNNERGLPGRSHFPWTDFEKEKLAGQFQSGISLEKLSEVFERSPTAISAQLKNLGVITEDEHDDYYEKHQNQKIQSEFNNQGISSLWHMTHRDNIESILKKGILSHTHAYEKAKPIDISELGVQERREKRKLHDYAVTYLNIKNPMLYTKKDMNNELCLIEISLASITYGNFIFTDGNAASSQTQFFDNIKNLSELPWEVLKSKYWSDLEDGKRKRCAEVMIFESIKPEYIQKIHCSSNETLQHISKFNVKAVITPELFFDFGHSRLDDENHKFLDFI